MKTPEISQKSYELFSPLEPKLIQRHLVAKYIHKKDNINSSDNIKPRLVLVTV